MLDKFTSDELHALWSVLPAPVRGLDPHEPGISHSLRKFRERELSYVTAYDKIVAALNGAST